MGAPHSPLFDPTGASGTEKLIELTSGVFSSVTSAHAFVVHRRNAASETVPKQTGFWHLGTGPGGETMPDTVVNGEQIRDDFLSNAAHNCGTPVVALNTPHVYEVQAASGSWANLLNGKTQHTSVVNTVDRYNPPQIGGNTLVGPNFYYGDMAELIFYNRILSASERALLVGYLNGRYGLGAK